MKVAELLSLDFSLKKNQKKLPKNIYGLKLLNKNTNTMINIFINHDGYCPNINTEREQSNYNDYLSNLEISIINEYCKLNNIENCDLLSRELEIMTNNKGELYHYSRSIN